LDFLKRKKRFNFADEVEKLIEVTSSLFRSDSMILSRRENKLKKKLWARHKQKDNEKEVKKVTINLQKNILQLRLMLNTMMLD
jgi:hypothetical protein